MALRLSGLRTYSVGSPGKRKRDRGAFNGRAVILSDGATLIRPTVRDSVGSPGKRKRNRGAFNDGAVILSDGATLIRPTVRYAGSSPGKRKRDRGEFNDGAVILSDGATLIRPTVRYSLVAPVSASATGERSMTAPLFCRMALRLSDLRSGIRW